MLNILINTIPHDLQRYPTVGDWQYPADSVTVPVPIHPSNSKKEKMAPTTIAMAINDRVIVSEMCNADYELLVAIHELVEMHLCKKAGVTDAVVTAFDMCFEHDRAHGLEDGEPGDDPTAPYHDQHLAATTVEKCLAAVLGVEWDAYAKTVDALT